MLIFTCNGISSLTAIKLTKHFAIFQNKSKLVARKFVSPFARTSVFPTSKRIEIQQDEEATLATRIWWRSALSIIQWRSKGPGLQPNASEHSGPSIASTSVIHG